VDVPQLQDTKSKEGFTTEALALGAQYEVRDVSITRRHSVEGHLFIGFKSVGGLCEEKWHTQEQTSQGCSVRVAFAALLLLD
jgi:hypothetical protein